MSAPKFLESAGLHALDQHAVMRVSGDDARTWLNGQITNDVRQTARGQSVYALVINLKGRVVADVWVVDDGDSFLLVLPKSSYALVHTQFDKYIIMEDVILSEASETRVLTVQGDHAGEIAATAGVPNTIYPADRLHKNGIDMLVESADFETAFSNLSKAVLDAGGLVLSSAAWEDARIALGRPGFGTDFGERTYPQEVGLEDRAVSFNKGCYLGQEVVCMLENRGQLTRRLVSLSLDGNCVAAAGDALTSVDGQSVGEITSVSSDKTGALAIVKRAVSAAGTELKAGAATVKVVALS